MSIIELSVAKQHLRIDESDEDTIVQLYLDAAEEVASEYIGRKFFKDATCLEQAIANDTSLDSPIVINNSITTAVLLITGHLYMNREAVTPGVLTEMPLGAIHLLQPFRINLGA